MINLVQSVALLLLVSSVACLGGSSRRIIYDEPKSHLLQLGKISDSNISLARTFFSPAHKIAAAQLEVWMREAGMKAWTDSVGNVHGQLDGSYSDLPMLMIGSHYDTVLDAGIFDGPLGIIAGIAAIKMTVASRLTQEAEIKGISNEASWMPLDNSADIAIPPEAAVGLLKRTVHIVAFTDEEGVRFQSTFLGSRAVAGTLIKYGMLSARDKSGSSLEDVLRIEGGVADPESEVARIAISAKKVAEYVEIHMEQGPVLERRDVALGVVSAIAGQSRLWLTINGTQGHAGTVPMRGRVDSLTAAAEVINVVERRCGGGPGGDEEHAVGVIKSSEEDMLVCTVGEVRVWPGASNVIPGNSQLSIDIRSKDDHLRAAVVANVTSSIQEICTRRGVACELKRNHDAAAVMCDDGVIQGFIKAIQDSQPTMSEIRTTLNLLSTEGGTSRAEGHSVGSSEGDASCVESEKTSSKSCNIVDNGGISDQVSSETTDAAFEGEDIPVMVSGAGHDAMAMAEVTKMGMMFVRCRGGVSHSPLEHVEPLDVAAATAALHHYIMARALTA
ncbi:hypothetical protein CEUSTIGMA_g10110.t1 [Chlamydomonas eustigma]|uniref:Peptidase M20 dimerisation domain-containing protein n=1 Tax=Chlamydomonas eustigma TaxID=1157962 RepID=A0A250XHY0_9CHLO|nr:hypothetical protein CEUSTIGMA_g10110.t1 [Chlamydomonas eustigma]|eukprot:GAX82684.1 hypothetical protein CEUSTIGMA_g10110.t1 [Chlamydomonas eustigma]